ncbi:sensor histidine kinase with PAs signal sensor domains [Filimonas lacunae]|nr:sensor histidine kinase with PAs signal sensor domains [Filimonas lacunae]
MVIGSLVYDFIATDDVESWQQHHTAVCAGETRTWNYKVTGAKGTLRHLQTYASPLVLPDGISMQIAITKDITDQKGAEASARESELKFSTLANSIQNLAWMADANGWVYWYNQKWTEYTGLSTQDMEGWGWQKVHHPDYLEYATRFSEQAWKTNQPFEIIHPLRAKDGSYRWFISRGTPICNEKGEIEQWMGTLTDIDDQKRGEERFRALADNAPLWIWLTDKSARVDYSNTAMLDWFGFNHFSEIDRRIWQNSVHPDDQYLLAQVVQKAYENQEGYHIECRLLNPQTSSYEWFLFTAAPRFINGFFDGFVGTANNIDVQKRSFEALETRVQQRTRELNNANDALQRSNQELIQFAHTISHDLKEPIRKVGIYADMLQADIRKSDTSRIDSHLQKIDRALKRMNSFIDGVLSYSSLSAEAHEREAVDLNSTLSEIKEDLEVALIAKQASLQAKDTLPVIHGAPVLIYQLFYNIIGNAIKFSRPGVPPHIAITCSQLSKQEISERNLQPDKAYWTICIKDNGIGFSIADAQKIFGLHTRLQSREEYEGTGLGLALCARIAARHDGSIEAEGVPGEGALFKVILPE